MLLLCHESQDIAILRDKTAHLCMRAMKKYAAINCLLDFLSSYSNKKLSVGIESVKSV